MSELPFALIWQKTCEMGSAYNAKKAEKIQLAAELEAAVNDLAGVKGALADREKSLEESRPETAVECLHRQGSGEL